MKQVYIAAPVPPSLTLLSSVLSSLLSSALLSFCNQGLLELPSFSSAAMAIGTRGTYTFVDIIIAILLPPLGVFLRYGCAMEFWICLLLTILGYIPGILYAIWVIVG